MESTENYHRRIHPEKKGIRVFGVAESFTKNSTFSTRGGVVLRRDMLIDGVVLGRTLVGGNNATNQIISMFKKLDRTDVNCIMLNGLIISIYDVVAGEKIHESTGIPVIGVTYQDSPGIEERFFDNFDSSEAIRRVEAYRKLGIRERATLKTGMRVYVRSWGISSTQRLQLLNSFIIQGKIPEPLRIARLVSRAARNHLYEG